VNSCGRLCGGEKAEQLNLGSLIGIVDVGDDARRKGIDLAQAAMKFVRACLPNAKLIVISNEVMCESF